MLRSSRREDLIGADNKFMMFMLHHINFGIDQVASEIILRLVTEREEREGEIRIREQGKGGVIKQHCSTNSHVEFNFSKAVDLHPSPLPLKRSVSTMTEVELVGSI